MARSDASMSDAGSCGSADTHITDAVEPTLYTVWVPETVKLGEEFTIVVGSNFLQEEDDEDIYVTRDDPEGMEMDGPMNVDLTTGNYEFSGLIIENVDHGTRFCVLPFSLYCNGEHIYTIIVSMAYDDGTGS